MFTFTLLSMDRFLVLSNFLMIPIDVLTFHILVLFLNYSVHVGFQHKLLRRIIKNMTTTKEMANYIATTRKRNKETTITKLVLSV